MNMPKENKDRFIEAEKISNETNKNGVSSSHLLLSYLNNDSEIERALRCSALFFESFKVDLDESIHNFKLEKNETRISNELKSVVAITSFNKDKYELFGNLLETQSIKKILKKSHTDPSEVLSYLRNTNKETAPKEASKKRSSKNIQTQSTSNLLIDLNKKVINSKIPKMIGRNEEVQKIIQILQRQTKSSPILVGESGVGKSTIIENLALQIEMGNVPTFLKGKKIMELNTAELLADTTLQGQLEKKITALISEIKDADGDIILFIDNMHSIAKESKQANRMGIAELIKPALSRGEFACIGTTTSDNYRPIESDTSLERIFQKVNVEQPSVPETISILRGLKLKFENHHSVEIDDKALISSVKLADRYLMERCFPDKAIDVIDEASAIVKIALDSEPQQIIKLKNKISQKVLEKDSVPVSYNDESNEEIAFIEKEIIELNDELEKIQDLLEEDLQTFNKELFLKDSIQSATPEELEEIKAELNIIEKKGFKVLKTKVTEQEILEVVAQKTGVPLDKIGESDKEKVLKLESRLNKTVIGQKEAVSAVSASIRRSQAGLSNPKQPTGSFLFLGSTGVGKTELCKQLAIELFDNEDDLLRFDMSEFQEKHTVSQLIGSPVGYEGSTEGGKLTESVRKKPYSIVLFDEIEKAHSDVLNLLLQILDDGRLTDSRGTLVNFKNTIVVMTSNIGSEHIKERSFLSGDPKKKVIAALEKAMRPELINRIDEKIIFERLQENEIAKICKISLSKIEERLSDKKIKIDFPNDTISYLASVSNDPKYGARPLNRKIKTLVEDKLANDILNNSIEKGDSIIFKLDRDGARILTNDE